MLILVAIEDELKRSDLPDHKIEYIGVGKVNAVFNALNAIKKHSPKQIINFGTAGSLDTKIKGLVEVSTFFKRDMDASPLGFKVGQTPFEEEPHIIECYNNEDFNPIGQNTTCGSGDNFSIDESDWDKWDVVDMEAYSLAKVCRNFEIPFISFKYITDGADDEADSDWETNVKNGVEIFKEEILGEL